MDGWLNSLFIKKLSEALRIKTPDRIPRSGEEGAKANCYSVYVTDAEGSYLAKEIKGEHLHVLKWDEDKRTHDKKKLLNLTDIDSWNFEISHYHGLVTHTYKSRSEFLLIDASGFYKMQSKLALWKYSIPKFIHSKKRLKRPSREKALEAAIDLVKDNHNLAFDSYRLLNEMYGAYTILHPLFPTLKQGTHLVLMSLAESGELQQVNSFDFRVNGKALSTLEHLREERSKEERSRRQASMMLWLTVVLAFAALFQSGLVRTTHFSSIDWLMELLQGYMDVVKEFIRGVAY
ncbi:hypothetical protein ACEI17_002619 [Vibrio vulnificus]|nr:hypothetical protein [Vibrio vulnificus]EGR0095552.1 hypothetical protein [Vibrio vulnificus]EGR0104572.1 hypothetical protein [Vibrio vulnificus]EHY0958162.1 hypothetical protein [Vibrio vulnificus]EJY4610353.1 hypothetical protein [Vibrio vulnificus]